MTSETAGIRRPSPAVWIGLLCVIVISLAAGIWAAFTPSIGPFVKPTLGTLMIASGLMLLSPFATTSPPINEQQRRAQRKFRKGMSVVGGANILFGLAQLLPGVWSSALMGLALLVIVAGYWHSRSSLR
jgi:hypothetical protein